jgi:hypothetical protein
MNAELMGQYINFVADRLLVALGAQKHYNTPNPFEWMEQLSLQCAHTCPAAALLPCLHWHIVRQTASTHCMQGGLPRRTACMASCGGTCRLCLRGICEGCMLSRTLVPWERWPPW